MSFQALGAAVAATAKVQRAAKVGLLLMDAPPGGTEGVPDTSTALGQLATGMPQQVELLTWMSSPLA